jgi:hypothetical protein
VRALGRGAGALALALVGVAALRVLLGPVLAALIVGPMLWAAALWALARLDGRRPSAPARAVERTPAAPVGQLDQARQAAIIELADAVIEWRDGSSHPDRRGAA